MLTESLVEAFRSRLEAMGFDLADLRIGGTPNRPLVQVIIDCPPRQVTVEDCSRVSRALEQWLDADGGGGGGALGKSQLPQSPRPRLRAPGPRPPPRAPVLGPGRDGEPGGNGPRPGPGRGGSGQDDRVY